MAGSPAPLADHWCSVDGRRAHSLVSRNLTAPGAPEVVVLHGMVVASRSVAPLAVALAEGGCRVWVPDQPGFGLSAKPAGVLGVGSLARWAAAWMQEVGISGATVLGNSFGCQAAVALAQGWPHLVDRLVLLAPTVDPRQRRALPRFLRSGERGDPWAPARTAAGRAALDARDALEHAVVAWCWRAGGPRPSLAWITFWEYLAAGLLRSLGTIRHCLADAVEARLPSVRVPTLVIRAERDHVVSPRWVAQVAGALPDACSVTVAGAGHSAQFAAGPAVARQVLEFLGR